MNNMKTGLAAFGLISVAAFWGASFGVSKLVLVQIPLFLFITLRFGLGFAFMLPFCLKQLRDLTAAEWLKSTRLGAVLFVIFLFETTGILMTTVSNAAILISLNVVLTPIVERLVLRTPLNRFVLLSLPTSVVGIVLLGWQQSAAVSLNWGDVCILAAAALRAILLVSTKRMFNQHSINAMALTTIQSGVVMVLALLMSRFVFTETWTLPHSLSLWGALLFLVVFCTIFAFIAKNYGIQTCGPTRAAYLLGAEPLFGAAFAVVFFGDTLSWIQWLGCALMIGATFLVLSAPNGKTSRHFGNTSANTKPSRSTTSPTLMSIDSPNMGPSKTNV